MTGDNILHGPGFGSEPVAQDLMDEERKRVAKHMAQSIDAILREGLRRVTDEEPTPEFVQARCYAITPANSTETTYFCDGEAFLVMLPPETRNEIAADGQWVVAVDIYHRFVGKAAR